MPSSRHTLYHCTIVDHVRDQEKLTEEEQAVLDNHEDNVEDLMEGVKDLLTTL